MQFSWKWTSVAACCVAACATTAYAGQNVAVGRVELQLPGGDETWQVYALSDAGVDISGSGVTFNQKAETKVLVRRTADRVIDAALIVRANVSGKGRFSGINFPNASCTGGPGVFAEGDQPGPGARSFQCMAVVMPGEVTGLKGVHQPIQAMLAKDGWTWPPTMQIILAQQYAHTGAYVHVTALLLPERLPALAEPQPKEGADAQPAFVTAASLKWGRLLQEAATSSVYSIRGKLAVPELAVPELDMPSESDGD